MRVIATGRGHCGKQLREPGDEFDFDEAKLKKNGNDFVFPSWFKQAERPTLQAKGKGKDKDAEELM